MRMNCCLIKSAIAALNFKKLISKQTVLFSFIFQSILLVITVSGKLNWMEAWKESVSCN